MLAAVLAAMVVIAIWAEIDVGSYYRVLGALAVLNVFLVVLQFSAATTRAAERRP